MYIAYYDESGDDGYPQYSSPFFVLSAVYLHYLSWKSCFEDIRCFRRELKKSFGLPVGMEMHTKHFLLNKKPYCELHISQENRREIIRRFCELIGGLNVKVVNVVIVKPRISRADYQVLDKALTYSIQRIENDLQPKANPNSMFLLITDRGREGKMRKTTRRIQRFNYIPSRFGPPYRGEIQSLIEDPLPKESQQSYFIQLADVVSFVVYLYSVSSTQLVPYPKRLSKLITPNEIEEWMAQIKPRLNLKASQSDRYGVVFHPKN